MQRRSTISTLVLLLASAVTVSSCSLVDAPQSDEAITDVSQYYYPLTEIGSSFSYSRISAEGTDTIMMTMQGNDAEAFTKGIGQCYAVGVSNEDEFNSDLYFVVNDSEASTLGNISCSDDRSRWIDLKSPLAEGQVWTFNTGNYYSPATVTATVVRRGAQMKMQDGGVFDDVTEVRYVSAVADTTTKWFARGVGLIYSTSTRSENYFGSAIRLIRSSR